MENNRNNNSNDDDDDNDGEDERQAEQQDDEESDNWLHPIPLLRRRETYSSSSNNSSSDDNDDDDDDDDSDGGGGGDDDGDDDDDDDDDDEQLSVEEKRAKMASLLELYAQLPVLVRQQIDEQVDNALIHTKRTVQLLITDNNYTSDNYQGLDGDRDTQDEVETAVRFFPGVLSTKDSYIDIDGEFSEGVYPIVKIARPFSLDGCCLCNIKALPFLILLAQLGTEIGQFQEGERGGLIPTNYHDFNVIQLLAHGIDLSNKDTTEHQQLVHNLFRAVLQQLKDIGLIKKDDVLEHYLVRLACRNDGGNYTESRLRFFIDWDPACLTRPQKCTGYLPLHDIIALNGNTGIQWFQSVFKAGIMYFPKKKGMFLLFRTNIFGSTPFKNACKQFGRNEVVKVVENTIVEYYSGNNNNNNNTINIIPYNPVDAFLTAVSDENIHLDGAYFFLRRHPDILKKLVSSSAENNDEGITRTNENNNTGLLMNTTTTTTSIAVPVPVPEAFSKV